MKVKISSALACTASTLEHKRVLKAWMLWLMPRIISTWQAEIRRTMV
jgi:hypothetical protein